MLLLLLLLLLQLRLSLLAAAAAYSAAAVAHAATSACYQCTAAVSITPKRCCPHNAIECRYMLAH